ncbi:MAG TPA: S8 family serine peptidase, partial [Mycobacteriales bacterium]|nr:S8 family serine peptidase [Mycobacteriales bacterium]
EANNGVNDSGVCPNCEVMELRVGESFVAEANRFAEAVLYGTDRGANIVQEALGTYNDPVLAREAIDYAYYHGVTVIASAADEAAEHHNQPGAFPHTIVVNAVRGPETILHPEGSEHPSINTAQPPSWLQLDGCTNFGTRVDLSVEGNSCSSEATGKSSGVTGLIYSAALNACGAGLYGSCSPSAKLKPAGDCTRVNGEPCVITPDEVQQLLASGNIAGTTADGSSQLGGKAPSAGNTSADEGAGGQADDVNTALSPEAACSVGMAPSCTDPNLNTTFAADENGGVVGPLPDTVRYPSRKGFDEFFGFGRLDAYKAVAAASQGWVPPEADITSPEWFD